MPCQFNLGYGNSFEPSAIFDPMSENSFGNRCQFEQFSEQDLIHFSGKYWCPFHLPLSDLNGNSSSKAAWDFMCQSLMGSLLAKYVDERCAANKPIDLTGLMHWDRLTLSMRYSPDLHGASSNPNRSFPSISIEGAKFPRGVDFSQCNFTKNFHSRNTYFGNQADFLGSTFNGSANFSGSVFERDVQFNQCKFMAFTDFSGVSFRGNVNFFDVEFSGFVSFALHVQMYFFSPSAADDSIRNAMFMRSRFESGVIFNDRKFLSGPNFSQTEFHVAPEFHNCQLHQSANFDGAKFLDVSSEGSDRAYRTLKLVFEALGSRDEQAMFFVLEQKARAMKPSTPTSIRVFSDLYRDISDYGQDFISPLVVLFAFSVLCAALYWWLIPLAVMKDAHQTFFGLITFTVEQMARPFTIWSRSYEPTLSESGFAFVLRLISTIHALASLGLITVSLLALRRRFKLE